MKKIFALILFSIVTIIIICNHFTIVNINNDTYLLVNLRNAQLKRRGLSHLNSLPSFLGAKFLFKKEGRVSFWMKDMKFNIDMYFLDASNNIVSRQCNISPCKENECPLINVDKVKTVVEILPREDCQSLTHL